jgi:chemotaxis methyl-accepting protein methylase
VSPSIPSPETSFDAVARLLARRVGHRLDATRKSRLSRASAEEAARLGLEMHDYVTVLDRDPTVLQCLLNRVTVQETSFFRDANQFEALAQQILPALPRPVTIWSAGCANGQEAYSVAMLLAEAGDRTSRVIATDISTQALERARRGAYSAREVADLGERRDRFFVPVGRDFEITADIRARVEFRVHNLFSDPPPFGRGACPIVLCRNVLIYFGRDEVLSFVERVADWLPPRGWLFLGYSESLWQVTERFQLVRLGDAFVYQRSDGTASAPASRAVERSPDRAPKPRRVRELAIDASEVVAADDQAAAILGLRKQAYLDPDQPLAHLHLGLALEAAGDTGAARRAFGACRAALVHCDTAVLESALEGYTIEELTGLVEAKLGVRP